MVTITSFLDVYSIYKKKYHNNIASNLFYSASTVFNKSFKLLYLHKTEETSSRSFIFQIRQPLKLG